MRWEKLDMVYKDCLGIIYRVTNIINGKLYIGQTTQGLFKRKFEHESRSKKETCNMPITRAIDKYGKDSFVWEILEYCDSKEELDEMEFHYIKQYKADTHQGYNCTLGGEGSHGFKHSEAVCEFIRKMKTGVKMSTESIARRTEKQSYRWRITYPDGKEEDILNLADFCKRHLLNSGIMGSVSRGYRKHHKGFKCIKLSKRSKVLSNKTKDSIKKANTGKRLTEDQIKKRTETQGMVWEIIGPNGDKLVVRNLKNYCRNNNINYECLTRVGWGHRPHHKGFKCRKLTNEELYNLSISNNISGELYT